MINVDKLDIERAERYIIPRFNLNKLYPAEKSVFFKFALNKTDSKLRCVNRDIHLLQKICKPADMILVTVSNDYTSYSALTVNNMGKIRNYKVNARKLCGRKRKTTVHDKHIAFILIKSHILSDFVHSAQKRNSYLFFLHWRKRRRFLRCLFAGVVTTIGIPFSIGGFLRHLICICH